MNPCTNMYGIQQIGDDTGQFNTTHANFEGKTYFQQQEPTNSVQNSPKYVNLTTASPYPQVNLQVLNSPNQMSNNNDDDKEEREVQLMVEKRFANGH